MELEVREKRTSSSKNEKPTDREKAAEAILSVYRTPEDKPIMFTNEGVIKSKLPGAIHGDLFGECCICPNIMTCNTGWDTADKSHSPFPFDFLSLRALRGVCTSKTTLPLRMNPTPNNRSACFYMTRDRFRPFLYFPEEDILITTPRSYAWKYEKRIGLRGCILLDLLLDGAWKKCGLPAAPPTNFISACAGKKIKIDKLAIQNFTN